MTALFRRARRWSAAAALLALSLALTGCNMYALINDVTTDLANPPVYFKAPPETPAYNAAKYRAIQEQQYPDLHNLETDWAVGDAFARVLAVVRQRGWTIAGVEESKHRVQAVSVTAILRFRDDVIIEVRPGGAPDKSVIAMRSKSRLGRSDFGANAKRIRAFLADVKAGP